LLRRRISLREELELLLPLDLNLELDLELDPDELPLLLDFDLDLSLELDPELDLEPLSLLLLRRRISLLEELTPSSSTSLRILRCWNSISPLRKRFPAWRSLADSTNAASALRMTIIVMESFIVSRRRYNLECLEDGGFL